MYSRPKSQLVLSGDNNKENARTQASARRVVLSDISNVPLQSEPLRSKLVKKSTSVSSLPNIQSGNTKIAISTTAESSKFYLPSTSKVRTCHTRNPIKTVSFLEQPAPKCIETCDMQVDNQNAPPSLIPDIDKWDIGNPLSVGIYAQDIFNYAKKKETIDRITGDYMAEQHEINEHMRATLVDWLVEVHAKFRLLSDTVFLSVSIIDKFLSKKPVMRSQFQLLGVTAMWIASKYEEIYPVELGDLVYICDNSYDKEDIIQLERNVLNILRFNLTTPSPLFFLRRFSRAAQNDSRGHGLAKYVCELSLLSYSCTSALPSEIAASAVYLARRMSICGPYWSPTLEYYTGYTEQQIKPLAREMNELIRRFWSPSEQLRAVQQKYSYSKLGRVSSVPAATAF